MVSVLIQDTPSQFKNVTSKYVSSKYVLVRRSSINYLASLNAALSNWTEILKRKLLCQEQFYSENTKTCLTALAEKWR